MLKMRGPIQLKIGLPTSVASDSFCQRMTGNYQLMNARITPKDLLFLTTQPLELPEDLGGMNLNVSNAFTDVRNVTMDVVNNVVNRIMLDGHNSFTYQDQVYITTVLNKLGVTDVSYFMQEVRRLREEQNSQIELTKLYHQEVERTLQNERPMQGQEQKITTRENVLSQSVIPTPRYYIHNDIYNRLKTEDIYQEVSNIYHNAVRQGDRIENKELRIAEQLRLSRDLHLAQLKQSYLHSENVELHHYINRFEQSMETVETITEETLLSRAAEAVLLSTVDKVLTHVIQREMTQREPWVQITNSLHQTAENTIDRFEYYHSEAPVQYRQGDIYLSERQRKIEEEINLMQSITQLHSEQTTMIHQHLSEVEEEAQQPLLGRIEKYTNEIFPTPKSEGDTYLDLRQNHHFEENSLLKAVTRVVADQELQMRRQSTFDTEGEVPLSLSERTERHEEKTPSTVYREANIHFDLRQSSIEENINSMQSVSQQQYGQTMMIHQHFSETENADQPLRSERIEKGEVEIASILHREGDHYLDLQQRNLNEEINLTQSVTEQQIGQTTMIHQQLSVNESEEKLQLPERMEEHEAVVSPTPRHEGGTYLDLRQNNQFEENSLVQQVTRVIADREALAQKQSMIESESTEQPPQLERIEKSDAEISPTLRRDGDLYLDLRQRNLEEEINLMQSVTQQQIGQTTMIYQRLPETEGEEQPLLSERAEKHEDHVSLIPHRGDGTYRDLRQGDHYEENNLLQHTTRMVAGKETLVHLQPVSEVNVTDIEASAEGGQVTTYVERQLLETERILHERLLQNQAEQYVLEEITPAAIVAQLPNEMVIRQLYEQIGEPKALGKSFTDDQRSEYFQDRYYETDAVTREFLYQNKLDADVEDASLDKQPNSQLMAEMITRELKEIDRQNREREKYFQMLEQNHWVETRVPQADPQRTMRDALRAIEQPELVLRELQNVGEQSEEIQISAAQSDQQALVLRELHEIREQNETTRDSAYAPSQSELVLRETHEIKEQNEKPHTAVALEHILQGADSTTRQILETIFNYERNPEAALADGKLQKNNIGMLNADAMKFKETPAVLTHRENPDAENSVTQLTAEEIKVFEMFRERPQQEAQRARKSGQWDKVPIVLRREDNTAVEELVERLEEQRIRQMDNRTVYDEKVHNTVMRTDIDEQTRNVVTHNTEDIVELVNRTMARQMNTITDQVYRQMERKLQTERSRRGRF